MPTGLPSRVAQVVAVAVPDGRAAVVGLVGVGGSDAPAILDAVAGRLGERGVGVLRATGRRLERHDPLGALAGLVDLPADADDPATERKVRDLLLDRLAGGPAALLVEDAQWLDPASLRVLVGVVERAADRKVTVAVAHRPAPGDPALAALDRRRRPGQGQALHQPRHAGGLLHQGLDHLLVDRPAGDEGGPLGHGVLV